MATKRAASSSTINPEQKRRDIEKYSENIFYSARYSGESCSLRIALAFRSTSLPRGGRVV